MAKNGKKDSLATTAEDVRVSVSSIYAGLIEKRKQDQEEKEERKRIEREEREKEKEAKSLNEDGTKKSKKERREAELDNWKEIIVGLTGDDLEYVKPKKSKKKYKKWIDDDDNVVLTEKPKKPKKKNYNKEFEPELNMLKTMVADQNKFTADLQKRFNIAAGPTTKDSPMPNKTLVELASVINAGRSNSLGVLKEIGNLKKSIADLYMKQKKLDADLGGGSGFNTTDIGLMGSSIASSIFGDESFSVGHNPYTSSTPVMDSTSQAPQSPQQTPPAQQNFNPQPQVASSNPSPIQPAVHVESFDPSTWGGPQLSSSSMVPFETIPHEVLVEMNQSNGSSRFKAINTETGEEIQGYPLPAQDLSKLKFNTKDGIVKGEFDESYRLEVI